MSLFVARAALQEVEQRCTELEATASDEQQLASSAQALQNTIDHLESRLEVANSEKLDAQEELFNMRALRSPFDAQFPELQRYSTGKDNELKVSQKHLCAGPQLICLHLIAQLLTIL